MDDKQPESNDRQAAGEKEGQAMENEPNDIQVESDPGATALKCTDLLGIEYLDVEDINLILDTAEQFKEISQRSIKKVPALRGKTVVNIFFEPSTRTRTSFEIAAKRLSADAQSISASTSSLVKGETLDQKLPAGGYDLEQMLDIAIPMTDALTAAHARGITHRDLKPSNVLVAPAPTEGVSTQAAQGIPKVIDFGP